MNERDDQLSNVGRTRRDAMLDELVVKMRTHHGRRRTRRRAVALSALGVLLAGAVAIVLPRPGPQSPPEQVATADQPESHVLAPEAVPPPEPEDARAIRTALVQTDPAAADRYIVRTTEHRGILLTDEELLATLESIGRPTGLVRVGGEVWLTAAVADNELHRQPPPPRGL